MVQLWGNNQADTVRHMQEVVVLGNRQNEVVPVQKLTGKELETLNSFSVADAIRFCSGVQVKDYGGIGGIKTIDVRSMGANHVGFFYDGIELGNAQNGQVDLGKFSLDNLDEISLYNGQKSEIFKSAKEFASASSVYLKTRKPRFIADKRTNLRAFLRGGSFDLINPSALWEQKITNRISTSLNADYVVASGKYRFRKRENKPDGTIATDTTVVRQNGDIHALRLEAGINGYLDAGNWSLKSYYYNSERGIPGAIVANVWKRGERQWDRNFFVQGSIQHQFTAWYSMLANAKFANDFMRFKSENTTNENTFLQKEMYASLVNKFAILRHWDVVLSTDFQWNTLDASLANFSFPQRFTSLVALSTAFEIYKFNVQASLLGSFIADHTQSSKQSINKDEVTPSVFISYKPFYTENLRFRAFYKNIFRMPTFNDLYYVDFVKSKLNPEFAVQYNAGIQYEKEFNHTFFRQIHAKADVYYNEITDKIIATPVGGNYRWSMVNLGYVEIRGVDFSTRALFRLPHSIMFSTYLTYTYQQAQDFSDPNQNIMEDKYPILPGIVDH